MTDWRAIEAAVLDIAERLDRIEASAAALRAIADDIDDDCDHGDDRH